MRQRTTTTATNNSFYSELSISQIRAQMISNLLLHDWYTKEDGKRTRMLALLLYFKLDSSQISNNYNNNNTTNIKQTQVLAK